MFELFHWRFKVLLARMAKFVYVKLILTLTWYFKCLFLNKIGEKYTYSVVESVKQCSHEKAALQIYLIEHKPVSLPVVEIASRQMLANGQELTLQNWWASSSTTHSLQFWSFNSCTKTACKWALTLWSTERKWRFFYKLLFLKKKIVSVARIHYNKNNFEKVISSFFWITRLQTLY